MAVQNILTQIRPGMEVQAADGRRLGKIREVWIGADPVHSTDRCDEEACSRLEVHHRDGITYVPYNAIAGVRGKVVTLTLDGAAVHEMGWYRKPLWIQDEDQLPPAELYRVSKA